MAEKEYKALDLIEELGVCRSTVYRLLQRGAIKAYKRWGTSKRGDVWVIPQSALDEYRGIKNEAIHAPHVEVITVHGRKYLTVDCVVCGTPLVSSVDLNADEQIPNYCPHCGVRLREVKQ